MATKKTTSKTASADRKAYAYANSEAKYKDTVSKTRAAQDKVRKAKDLNQKAKELSIIAASERGGLNLKTGTFTGAGTRQKAVAMREAANERETRLRSMEDKNATTLKTAVRSVRAGDAARARVASKKKK